MLLEATAPDLPLVKIRETHAGVLMSLPFYVHRLWWRGSEKEERNDAGDQRSRLPMEQRERRLGSVGREAAEHDWQMCQSGCVLQQDKTHTIGSWGAVACEKCEAKAVCRNAWATWVWSAERLGFGLEDKQDNGVIMSRSRGRASRRELGLGQRELMRKEQSRA
jgi:hypothetical protein